MLSVCTGSVLKPHVTLVCHAAWGNPKGQAVHSKGEQWAWPCVPQVAPHSAGASATHSPLQFGFLVAALS